MDSFECKKSQNILKLVFQHIRSKFGDHFIKHEIESVVDPVVRLL